MNKPKLQIIALWVALIFTFTTTAWSYEGTGFSLRTVRPQEEAEDKPIVDTPFAKRITQARKAIQDLESKLKNGCNDYILPRLSTTNPVEAAISKLEPKWDDPAITFSETVIIANINRQCRLCGFDLRRGKDRQFLQSVINVDRENKPLSAKLQLSALPSDTAILGWLNETTSEDAHARRNIAKEGNKALTDAGLKKKPVESVLLEMMDDFNSVIFMDIPKNIVVRSAAGATVGRLLEYYIDVLPSNLGVGFNEQEKCIMFYITSAGFNPFNVDEVCQFQREVRRAEGGAYYREKVRRRCSERMQELEVLKGLLHDEADDIYNFVRNEVRFGDVSQIAAHLQRYLHTLEAASSASHIFGQVDIARDCL